MADRTTEEVLREALREAFLEAGFLVADFDSAQASRLAIRGLADAALRLSLPSDTTTLRVEVERLTTLSERLSRESDKWCEEASRQRATVAERDRELAEARKWSLLACAIINGAEWSGWGYSEQDGTFTGVCPICDRRRMPHGKGHADNCALVACLRAADALAPPAVPQTGDKT